MQRIALPERLEKRLQERFRMLVESQLNGGRKHAAGVCGLPGEASAWAATMGAYRFLNNARVTLPALVEPLRETARAAVERLRAPFVLLVHDWCKITYTFDASKRDLTQLTHRDDVGHELTSALLVSADDGQPIAPMELHLRTAGGMLSTRGGATATDHLSQVLPTMQAARDWNLSRPLVHVIDREADSVGHFREWQARGHRFLVRADDRRVQWQGRPRLLSEIAAKLRRQQAFAHVGQAAYRGRKAQLWVAATRVVLTRPAKKRVDGKQVSVPGRPLSLRLIVVQVRDGNNRRLAQWLLLTNVPATGADAALLARCYYWRWRIESFFKLLKSHGHQLEQWQQETGEAIARRLLVASMACVVVWQLEQDHSPEAEQFKDVLVSLSGRQMKRNRRHTTPALLAGLWVWLSMTSLLDHYSLRDLKRIAKTLPRLRPPPRRRRPKDV